MIYADILFLKEASVLRLENGGVPLRTSTHPRG